MTVVDQLLGQFIDAWKAGERPDIDDYLARADGRDRDALAERIGAWLEIAPTPDFDDDTRASIAAEPLLQAALQTVEAIRLPLPQRVRILRERSGMRTGEVASRIASRFGLADVTRTSGYLKRLEDGEFDSRRVSRRLLDALAATFGVDSDQFTTVSTPPAALPAGQAFFRSDSDAGKAFAQDIEALSRAALTPAPEPIDELDRLFFGGPAA